MGNKISQLTLITVGQIDRTSDYFEVVDTSAGQSKRVTVNSMLGVSGAPWARWLSSWPRVVGCRGRQTTTMRSKNSPGSLSPSGRSQRVSASDE